MRGCRGPACGGGVHRHRPSHGSGRGAGAVNFAPPDGPTAWLLTSLIGTVANVAAAVRLESRVLVYLSLTFVASTAFSGVSILGGALVWYFAALIGVAVLLTGLALARPGWLPPVYFRPLMILHPFVVRAVAVAATCVPLYLAKAVYALIIAMCGVYFAMVAAVPGPWRLRNFYAARAALTVAAAVAIWDLTGRGSDALLAASILLAVQAVGVALLSGRLTSLLAGTAHPGQSAGAPKRASEGSPAGASRSAAHGRWRADAVVTFGLQLVATVAFGAAQEMASFVQGFVSRGLAERELAVPLWIPVACSLAAGMVVAARWRGRTEWAPVAALAMAGLLSGPMGAWPLAVMLLLGAGYWAARGAFAGGTFRGRLILGARVAFTLAVPVTVAAIIGQGPARAEAAAFALLIALVCQQLLTAFLQRSGVRTVAPEATLAAFAGAGALVLIGLPFIETSPAHGLTAFALWVQLPAALAIGAMLVPKPAADKDWSATVWEAVPLGMSLIAAAVAFQSVSQSAGNVALILVVAYLAITAVRLPLRQHRWGYWWLARAAATVLALTAFHQLQEEAGPVVVAGEAVRPAMILVTVLALQLSLPLLASVRRRAPRWILADAGAVLLIQLVASAALAQTGSAEWQATSAAGLTALGAAASGYFLRREEGSVWPAPVAFGALLAFSDGNLLNVELLLCIFAAYAAVMVVAAPQRAGKGWYFVAARVLTAGLAVVLSYDITASPTVVSVTFAVVLAAQHGVRGRCAHGWRKSPSNRRPSGSRWRDRAAAARVHGGRESPGCWCRTTTGPLGCAAGTADAPGLRGGGQEAVRRPGCPRLHRVRGAVRRARTGAAVYLRWDVPGVRAAKLHRDGRGGAVRGAAAAAAGIVRRRRNVGTEDVEHWLWLVTAGSFAVTGLIVSPLADDWVTGAAVLVLSVVFFAASHVEGQPLLYPPAALAALGGAMALAAEVFPDPPVRGATSCPGWQAQALRLPSSTLCG